MGGPTATPDPNRASESGISSIPGNGNRSAAPAATVIPTSVTPAGPITPPSPVAVPDPAAVARAGILVGNNQRAAVFGTLTTDLSLPPVTSSARLIRDLTARVPLDEVFRTSRPSNGPIRVSSTESQNGSQATKQPPNPQNPNNSKQKILPDDGIDPPEPTSFLGQIPFFLNAVLSTPAGALPKGPLWIVIFDGFPEVVKQVKDYEPRMPDPWEIERAFGTITSSRYQSEKGCILAQSVTLPGEALITNVEGNQYNGFIRGRVGLGRQDFDLLRINFLNTNVLFVDNVIRPWTVMTGHLGMIARPKELNYRTNITVYRLGITDWETPPFILQQYNFWGACPVSIGSEELVYNNSTQIVKSADFTYQWYTTSSAKNQFATGSPPVDTTGTLDGQTDVRSINPSDPVAIARAIPIR